MIGEPLLELFEGGRGRGGLRLGGGGQDRCQEKKPDHSFHNESKSLLGKRFTRHDSVEVPVRGKLKIGAGR